MRLSDPVIKANKPSNKLQSFPDGANLHFVCEPNGSRWWKVRYRFAGKENTLSLGTYPEVSLKKARTKNMAMRELLSEGIDPSQDRQEKKLQQAMASENSFQAVAMKWHETWAVGKEPSHVRRILRRLELNVFKQIGSRPINSITAPMLVAMVKKTAWGA